VARRANDDIFSPCIIVSIMQTVAKEACHQFFVVIDADVVALQVIDASGHVRQSDLLVQIRLICI